MVDSSFQRLSADERRYTLRVAQERGKHRAHLLEKDIWVVATLGVLFDAPFSEHLIFKGGTSLSKVWQAIRRFSEDVDITYDIRAFAPDLIAGANDEALPPTRSQEKRWTRAIRARLDESGIAARALADRVLALSVARHKAAFYAENDIHGKKIDYRAAVSGQLQLVPSGVAQTVLADDYARMLYRGFLLDEGESFNALMERCAQIEVRANAAVPGDN